MISSLMILELGLCCTVSELARVGEDGTRTFKADNARPRKMRTDAKTFLGVFPRPVNGYESNNER